MTLHGAYFYIQEQFPPFFPSVSHSWREAGKSNCAGEKDAGVPFQPTLFTYSPSLERRPEIERACGVTDQAINQLQPEETVRKPQFNIPFLPSFPKLFLTRPFKLRLKSTHAGFSPFTQHIILSSPETKASCDCMFGFRFGHFRSRTSHYLAE
ncbi:hypothetical protein CEXT_625841 [Caerostris extrusa]|uniref:Uncharacterized protein n=1 Tax=Caerostris extrusa TaxID=172846 RepID=A0AAV4XLA1_CAEEX|nr:hypothetical protein CEXT_625841 [Caerostris extrusa]